MQLDGLVEEGLVPQQKETRVGFTCREATTAGVAAANMLIVSLAKTLQLFSLLYDAYGATPGDQGLLK